MDFKYGSLLSTVFSAAIMVGQAVAAPAETHQIEQLTPVIAPVRQAFQDTHLQETMLERRRLMYEARTNTLILTNIAMTARQEVALSPK